MSTLKNYLKEKFSGAEVSENKNEGSNESFTIIGVAVDELKNAVIEFFVKDGYGICDVRNRPIVYDGFSLPFFKEKERFTMSATKTQGVITVVELKGM